MNDSNGIIWVKNGSDKRKLVSKEEKVRLLQSSGNLYADETIVERTTINDIDNSIFEDFILISIQVLIFDNRIEIISPGKLPNTLTVENIKMGTSIPRNPILFTNASYILPFSGLGSGIPRALKNSHDLELINDIDKDLFTAIIKRP